MSQAPRRTRVPAISLFPFLAVLLCTIGALILLLLGLAERARGARLLAQQALPRPAAEDPLHDFAWQQEIVSWRVSEIARANAEAAVDLADYQLSLAQSEEHLVRLNAELNALEALANSLEAPTPAAEREQLAAEIEDRRRRVADLKAALAGKLNQARVKSVSYSVVPYDGPSGTRRRPIYIECTGEAIILQPEGIRFSAQDFPDPASPTNPLAAAVRASLEYYARQVAADPEAGKPYPLLLVRPDGIAAFYIAQASLASWGATLGYEMIQAEWEISYPSTDPQLKLAQSQAASLARQRQERIVRGAPRRYGGQPRSFDTEEWMPDATAGPRPRSNGSGSIANDPANSQVRGATGNPRYSGGAGGLESQYASGAEPRLSYGGAGEPSGDAFGNQPSGDPLRSESGYGYPNGAGAAGDGFAGTGSALGDEDGDGAGDGDAPSERVVTTEAGQSQGQTFAGQSHSGQFQQGQSQQGQGQSQQGQSRQGQGQMAGARRQVGSSGQPTTDAQADPNAPWMPGMMSAGGSGQGECTSNATCLADQRGKDWAQRRSKARGIPIARPIRIVCDEHQLIVQADRGPRSGRQVVPLSEYTEDSADALVRIIEDRVSQWGQAGVGMYWKPLVEFDVTPAGLQRMADLQSIFQDSGLELRQYPASEAQIPTSSSSASAAAGVPAAAPARR